ncbi:MAG: hypothetical protein QOJ20_478 [Mycobacterium sp.]|jgi:hypothetical protein|nr:hypothetical protein [Mycobacterium sp.]
MMEPPRSYSERRDLIAEKLEPHFGVSSLVPTNTESAFEPDLFENSLKCTWATRRPATTNCSFTSIRWLTVKPKPRAFGR